MVNAIVNAEAETEEGSRQRRNQRGATLVEYALLVALLALVMATAVEFLGEGTSARFQSVNVPFEDSP